MARGGPPPRPLSARPEVLALAVDVNGVNIVDVMAEEPETRERIVAAARDLIVAGGVEGLSMRKVAARVGISAPAIYRHFDGKDALLSAAVVAGAQTFIAYLASALSEPDARSRLRRMAERYFEFAEAHAGDYHLLFMLDCERTGMDRVDERARGAQSRSFQMLVDRVAECLAEGWMREGPAVEHAVFIWTSIHGLASVRLSGRLGVASAEYARLVQRQLDLIVDALARRES